MKKTLLLVSLILVMLLSACGAEKAVTVNLEEVYTKIEQTVELPEMLKLSASKAENRYGLTEADCKASIVAVCGDSVRADEIWLVEAKDAAAAARVKEIVQQRLNAKLEETNGYFPDQYEIVKNAQIVTNGNYVAFFVSPDAANMASVFTEAAK